MEVFDKLVETIKRLRAPDGCPWDREQTNWTLRYDLIEEAYEVLDAIEKGEVERLKEELGDIFLVTIMHAVIQEEQGSFTLEDVFEFLRQKLIKRHPHVFGDREFKDKRELLEHWEKSKGKDLFGDLPRSMPSLMLAQKIQEKAKRVGFDWNNYRGAFDKVKEEIKELEESIERGDKTKIEEEIGDLIFAVVNLARHLEINAEHATRKTAEKFIRRFKRMEKQARAMGKELKDMSLEDMDRLWEEEKRNEE